MYQAFWIGIPIPISLTHPRWLLDPPLDNHQSWNMGYRDPPAASKPKWPHLDTWDQYHDGGTNIMLYIVLAAVQQHSALTGQDHEECVQHFHIYHEHMVVEFQQWAEAWQRMPPWL